MILGSSGLVWWTAATTTVVLNTMRGFAGLTALPWQQPPCQMGPQERMPVVIKVSFVNNTMSPPQVSFSLSELSIPLIFICWYYGVSFWILDYDMAAVYTNGGSAIWVWTNANLWGISHSRRMCLLVLVHGPYRSTLGRSTFLCFGKGIPHATQTASLQPFMQYGVAYSFWDVAEQPIPLTSLYGREGSLFPDLVQLKNMINSKCVVGVKTSWFQCGN